jgi:hypothetical protein
MNTLYFWSIMQHNTHVLRAYQGYAVRNLTGGIAPSIRLTLLLNLERLQEEFQIVFSCVGQGFFVNGK